MADIDGSDGERWVTLRDANAITGASVSALRKWYRNGTVRSEEREGPHGMQRYVWLADVRERQRVWREAQEQRDSPVIPAPAGGDTAESAPEPAAAEGMVLVPMEAWQRTLDTISHGFAAMHEAGQDLAAAREMAGAQRSKAEFLERRVIELRDQLDRARGELEVERARPVPRRRWWGGVR